MTESLSQRNTRRAVLIGVSHYTDPEFPDIPAARNNVRDLADLLKAPDRGAFAAEECTVLLDPREAVQVGEAVIRAAEEAEDVLVVYFSGHGTLDRHGSLHLALSSTKRYLPEFSAVEFQRVRKELAQSRARNRILILDCCYSGKAVEAMSATTDILEQEIDIHGTYTITSSARDETSWAPLGERHTAFTAAFLESARTPGRSLDELYEDVKQTLRRKAQPKPLCRGVDTTRHLKLFTPPCDHPTGNNGGDQSEAERVLRRGAAQGSVEDMNDLANLLYEQGKLREANVFYHKAADRGSLIAMGNLANFLFQQKQEPEARTWYERAAAGGNSDAMYNYAIALEKKDRNFEEAITWYRRAADANHADACHNLAVRLRSHGKHAEAEEYWQRAGHKKPQRTNEKLRGSTPQRPAR